MLSIRLDRNPFPVPILTATVKSNEYIAKATREAVLEPPQGFTFQPGQYVTLLVPTPDGKKLGRSYSIASPAGRQDIVLTVKIVPDGLGSGYVDAFVPGQQVEFLGPLGRFLLSSLDNPFLFVATGAGIAPFVPMIDSLLARENSPRITLLLGFRHAEDAFYVERFRHLATQHPNFSFICCLSQPDEAWTGEKGRVTTYLQEHPDLAENAQVYICGNGSMTNEVTEIAASHGAPRERIFFEKYNNL